VFAEAPARYTRHGLPAGCLIASGDAGTTDATVTTRLHRLRETKVAAFADKIRADITSGELSPTPTHRRWLATECRC
jgi:hypothetical protein